MIIADTCLVFYLFNETPLTPKAQEILSKDSYWILPPLWREEYANILSKLARKERRGIEEVIGHFDYTVDELKNKEIAVDTKIALQVSLEYRISVYDAHFVALALGYNAVMVTEDKEILKNCPDIALSMKAFLKDA